MSLDTSSLTAPLIVVSGPSGSGKTSICRRVAQELGLYYSVSHTSRAKKASEVDGRDYFFVTAEAFQKLEAEGEFLEWAKVYDNFYGTSQRILLQKLNEGQGVILDLDTQGAAQIKALVPQSLLIFINTPTIDALKERLTSRNRDSANEIAKRMNQAVHEIAHIPQYDAVVVNDNLDTSIQTVCRMIRARFPGCGA
jgi:guanylate kinase